jgi:hypothetical protein
MTAQEREALVDMVEADYEAMDQFEERFELLRAFLVSTDDDVFRAVDALVDLGV